MEKEKENKEVIIEQPTEEKKETKKKKYGVMDYANDHPYLSAWIVFTGITAVERVIEYSFEVFLENKRMKLGCKSGGD